MQPMASGTVVNAQDNEPVGGTSMNGIIYLIGLIVVIMFILSLLGLR